MPKPVKGRAARPSLILCAVASEVGSWEEMVERFILALRSDFGCLVIIVAFVVIMISTIVFANIITPP